MLVVPSAVRIYLAIEPTDMRKGFDGLARLVEQQGLDLYSGHLFVFLSKRRDRIKVLTWERGGLVLYYKRLEKGRFRPPRRSDDGKHVLLDAGQLAMLLDAVDWQRARRAKVWQPPQKNRPLSSQGGSTNRSSCDLP